jgi:hypothetical protein
MKAVNTPSFAMAEEESYFIRNEIIHITDIWAEHNKAMNAQGCSELWLDSPELRHAENGEFFRSFGAILKFLEQTFEKSEAMFFEWRKREVQPLTKDIALFSGRFKFHLNFNDNGIWKGDMAMTATFVKRNGNWKIINGHESSRQS